jgi:hypothetical protein
MEIYLQKYTLKELATSETKTYSNGEIINMSNGEYMYFNRIDDRNMQATFRNLIPLYVKNQEAQYQANDRMGLINGQPIVRNTLIAPGVQNFIITSEALINPMEDVAFQFLGNVDFHKQPHLQPNVFIIPNLSIGFGSGGNIPAQINISYNLIEGQVNKTTKIVEPKEYILVRAMDENNQVNGVELVEVEDSNLWNALMEYAEKSLEVEFPQRWFKTGTTELSNLTGSSKAWGFVKNY